MFSNLLAISTYPENLHIAETEIREAKELWAKARELRVEIGSEWILSDSNIITFHDLPRYPWNRFCEVGTHEIFDMADWAESDDPIRQKHFVWLLNHALTERLKEWNVRKRKDDDRVLFCGCQGFPASPPQFLGSIAEQYRTVVQRYPFGKTSYIRHTAFGGYFKKMDNAWYLEITPWYIFTFDGFAPFS